MKLSEMNDKKYFFRHSDGEYYLKKSDNYVATLPRISAFPEITWKIPPGVPNRITSLFTFPRVLNHPAKLKEPSIYITGAFGSGKSQHLTLIQALKLGQGYKGLSFDRRHFESRHLALYGVFKKKEFIPFNLTLWIPEKYQPKKTHFLKLWEERKNVKLEYWKGVQDIIYGIGNTKGFEDNPYTHNAIYTECFDQLSRLKLFLDLMKEVQCCKNSRMLGYNPAYFTHHEISTLLPMYPPKNGFHVMEKVSNDFVDYRKDDIMMIAASQARNEVYYRFRDKFLYRITFQSVHMRRYSPQEEQARNFPTGTCNIGNHAFWVKHVVGPITEVVDAYRIYPGEIISYPELTKTDETGGNLLEKFLEERCTVDFPNGEEICSSKNDFYQAFNDYCIENDNTPYTKSKVTIELKKLFPNIQIRYIRDQRYLMGISVY